MEDDIAPSQLVSSPTSPKEASVKSNAVVKYSLVETPVMYAPLSHNTNIKLPPRNWLSSAAASRGLHEPTVRSSGFSSFRMANMFPESVGEVDVVSDAENIKKLLKIPYSSKSVSMVVHRVENTLLIDEFDIHKHLLSRAENEWAWLRQYFIEHILSTLSSKDKALPYHAKSRTALQQRSLVSKFLHYSLAETDDNNSNKRNDTAKSDQSQTPLPLATKGPALPEPRIEQGIPCSNDDHQFTRNVLWTFEDIQMLLGTDLPIFGGPTRPCISLRLRDANQPISVLTGIDYWLDNLMSNVPEVVMCYHLDGIVQKYELIKTEDLPNLKESKFSPNLIRDVAQNILSFLKANATKAGHTYWLFKGTNEDAVKLYDLTSLCSDTMRDKEQNPFTIPVGMLLYRVARNMMATGLSPGQNNTIRTVLKNCISLLSKEKYPQIVTSAHFMLADVYIPDDTDPSSPDLLSQSEHELSSMDDEDDADSDESAPVTSLLLNQALAPSKPRNGKYDQPPIGKCGIEERCRNALNHICEGLKCLQYFESPSQKLGKEKEAEPKMANPNQAIPMPFDQAREKGQKKKKKGENAEQKEDNLETDDSSLKAVLCKPHGKTMPTWQRPEEMDNGTWKSYLSSLLARKACLVYSILIEREIDSTKNLSALEHIRAVLRCCGDNRPLAGLMMSRAGDCFYSLSISRNGDDSPIVDDEDEAEYPSVEMQGPSAFESEMKLLDRGTTKDELFEATMDCYKRSVELCPTDESKRRTGNACNMISTYHTNRATELIKSKDVDAAEVDKLIKKSEELLAYGIKMFESVGDTANTALLLSNSGRLHRLKCYAPIDENSRMTPHTKIYHTKAVDCYTSALQVLRSRKSAPAFWDLVYWELSTTLYTLATLNQDHPQLPGPNKTIEEIEREAAELLLKAIRYCDLASNSYRQPLYQFRAATLHQRLGSLYFNSFRTFDYNEGKAKQIVQLCQINYSKAISLFWLLDNPLQVVRVQLELLALYELVADESKSVNLKIKNLQKALSVCSDCKQAISSIIGKNSTKSTETSEKFETEDEEELKILRCLHSKFNTVLLALIKLISSSEKNSDLVDAYKKIYVASLKIEKGTSLVAHLDRVFNQIP
ncbi:Chromosome 10 open reading frame 137 [Nesidiocoris tenuis]|uniref:Chromosome 10 open reading frame 137 n=1 Tax=Nesidiocoris tenuis TaxID=355587 RepID=A0ABN7BB32_9HEMI|nr:Chromosome 10 open reading frame 137 [Nesidiocoris tenuis]